MNKKYLGSDFDDFLKEDKILKRTNKVAAKRVADHVKKYHFSKGKRGAVVRAPKGKTRITIRLDDDVLDWFQNQVEESGGGNYQTLINNALREFILKKRAARTSRQTFQNALAKVPSVEPVEYDRLPSPSRKTKTRTSKKSG